jgi:dynein heavy chain
MEVKDLNPDDIETRFRKMKGKANSLRNQFEQMKIDGKSDNKPAKFAKSIFHACTEFEPWIRVIRALRTEGLEQKHVDMMNAAIDKENGSVDDSLNTIKLKMDTTISNFGSVKITEVSQAIEEVADTASKEYSNITLLKAMREEWEVINFDLKEHKDTHILEGEAVENITTLLDDQTIKTQTMKGSPYAVFMLDPILEWEALLDRTTDFLEVWVAV